MKIVKPTDKTYFFTLNIPYTHCQVLYQSAGQSVILIAESGLRIQVPFARLRPFIDSRGVQGRFRMIISAERKIKSFERIA
ncbi:DUF2835 family protein [Alteromonas sp. C1M14]|uniref:DUF2835 family protein n=1 Tax=Alteromonas sp. C1M14 TaxID=2841567 RepID=UPI001C081514|nr:DUF2835 family protein [Alteromonas sp. C1M14]MBU2976898.1 DUF2835 domain-containing protein [Alteromonas sp. C1M14]